MKLCCRDFYSSFIQFFAVLRNSWIVSFNGVQGMLLVPVEEEQVVESTKYQKKKAVFRFAVFLTP